MDSNPNPNIDNNQLLDIYNIKINNHFTSILQRKYLFEITKCCGFSEIVSIYKDVSTLKDLYKSVISQFCHNTLIELYVENILTGERVIIPNDDNILRDFVNNNQDYFKPLYPLPASVVYRIYFDDGHVHIHT